MRFIHRVTGIDDHQYYCEKRCRPIGEDKDQSAIAALLCLTETVSRPFEKTVKLLREFDLLGVLSILVRREKWELSFPGPSFKAQPDWLLKQLFAGRCGQFGDAALASICLVLVNDAACSCLV